MSENRRCPRYAFSEEVEFVSPREARATALDLAEGGIGLAAGEEFPPGTRVVLKMFEGVLLIQGTVRWCRKAGGEYRIGVQFAREDWLVLEKLAGLERSAPAE